MLSWGGTYGACATAVHNVQAKGKAVTHCHLRYLNPLPKDLGDILKRFKKVLDSRAEPGPAADDHPRASTWSMRSASTRCKASRSASPKWSRRSKRSLSGDTSDTQAAPEPIDSENDR